MKKIFLCMLALLLSLPTMAEVAMKLPNAQQKSDLAKKLSESMSMQEKVARIAVAAIREYLQDACTPEGKLDEKNALKVFMDKLYIDEELTWPENLAAMVYADHAVGGETTGSGVCEDMIQVVEGKYEDSLLVNHKKCRIEKAFFTQNNDIAVEYWCHNTIVASEKSKHPEDEAAAGEAVSTAPALLMREDGNFGTMIYDGGKNKWKDHMFMSLSETEPLCTAEPAPSLNTFDKKLKQESLKGIQKQMQSKAAKMEALRAERQKEQEKMQEMFFYPRENQ